MATATTSAAPRRERGVQMMQSIADRLRALEPKLRDDYYRLSAIDDLKVLAEGVERLEDVARIAGLVYELWVTNHYRDETDDAIEAMHELGEALEKADYETPISREFGRAIK